MTTAPDSAERFFVGLINALGLSAIFWLLITAPLWWPR